MGAVAVVSSVMFRSSFHVEDRRVFLRHVDKSDSQTVRHAFASEKGVNRNVLQRVVSDVFDCSLM